MTAATDFQACDELNVTITGNISSDPPVITPGPLNQGNVAQCVPKPPGSLALIVTAAEFGLPQLPLSLEFQGAPAGVDGSGNPLVRWAVDKAYNITVPVQGMNATIKHIKGSVTVALQSIPNPTSIPSCGGDCHSHVVSLFSSSQNDHVDVDVYVDAYGGQSGTIHLTNLSFFGTAAKAVGRDLSIGVRKDNCGVGAVQGGIAELFSTLGSYANPMYKWTLDAGDATFPMGETGTHPTAKVQVGALPFTATLTVTDGSCVVSRRITVDPLTAVQATEIERICKLLQEYTLINMFWNPLGPDVRLPLTETNVLKIRAAAETALAMTGSWLALQSGVRGDRG